MVSITGQLTDADSLSGIDQTPLYFDKKLVGVTDDAGNYTIDVAPGEYRMEVRPREFMPMIRDVRVTTDGRIIDRKTNKVLRKILPLTRATL